MLSYCFGSLAATYPNLRPSNSRLNRILLPLFPYWKVYACVSLYWCQPIVHSIRCLQLLAARDSSTASAQEDESRPIVIPKRIKRWVLCIDGCWWDILILEYDLKIFARNNVCDFKSGFLIFAGIQTREDICMYSMWKMPSACTIMFVYRYILSYASMKLKHAVDIFHWASLCVYHAFSCDHSHSFENHDSLHRDELSILRALDSTVQAVSWIFHWIVLGALELVLGCVLWFSGDL